MQLWWEVVRSGAIAWGRLGPHLLAPSPGLIWSAKPTWLVWSTLPTWSVYNTIHLVGLVNTNGLVGKWQVSDHWIIRSTDLQILRSSGQQVSGSTILRSSDPQIMRSPELQNCRTAFWVLLSFTEICKENSQISRSVDSQIKRSPELQICKENLKEVCISFVC